MNTKETELTKLGDEFAILFRDREITLTTSPLILHFIICMLIDLSRVAKSGTFQMNEQQKIVDTINLLVGTIQEQIPESKPLFDRFKSIVTTTR